MDSRDKRSSAFRTRVDDPFSMAPEIGEQWKELTAEERAQLRLLIERGALRRATPEELAEARPKPKTQYDVEDVLNAIDMFFDTLLRTNELSEAVQNIVGRLQLPIVKVAIVNPGFLTDARHPGRRLLKLIVSRHDMLDSSFERDNDYYERVRDIVDDLVRGFSGDERRLLQAYYEIKELK